MEFAPLTQSQKHLLHWAVACQTRVLPRAADASLTFLRRAGSADRLPVGVTLGLHMAEMQVRSRCASGLFLKSKQPHMLPVLVKT